MRTGGQQSPPVWSEHTLHSCLSYDCFKFNSISLWSTMGIFTFDSLRREGIQLTSPLLGSSASSSGNSNNAGSRRASSESSLRDEISREELVTTAPSSKTPTHLLRLFTRSRSIVLVCLSCIILLLLLSLPSIDASSYTKDLKALHADWSDVLASKWKEATSSTSSSKPTLDRSWDYYAQNGIFVNQRNNQSLPQNRRARFIPVDKIDELAEKGLSGLEGEVKLGDGFDEVGKYVQGELAVFLPQHCLLVVIDHRSPYSCQSQTTKCNQRTFVSPEQDCTFDREWLTSL